MNVERIACLHISVACKTGPDSRQFDNVAFTRHCAAVSFGRPAYAEQPRWTKSGVCPFSRCDKQDAKTDFAVQVLSS